VNTFLSIAAATVLAVVTVAPALATPADSLAGRWAGSFSMPGPSGAMTLELVADGAALGGRLRLDAKDGTVVESDVRAVEVTANAIAFDATLLGASSHFTGTIDGDRLRGTVEVTDHGETVRGQWEVGRARS
jgi:hypothetical protein